MKVAFLVNDLQLSGGVGVVVQHARRLSLLPGWDVTLVLVREDEGPSWHGYEHLPDLHVRGREEAMADRFDVAVATWWETTFTLFEIPAGRHAYFVQSLEDRFYLEDQAERLGAALTLDLPVAFITEARWIAQLLGSWRPDAPCFVVRNGIDKEVFAPLERVTPAVAGPLRVLVEGSPTVWHKRVPEAIAAVGAMREPHEVTVVSGDRPALAGVVADRVLGPLSHREMADLYAEHHVVCKLSTVEGMAGPPLEGFHRGATCVVTPVTGHDEYVEHGYNALITDWDDLTGTARSLDLLARDRKLLHYLRSNALETARAWPDWGQSSQFMAAALTAIVRLPQPGPTVAAARLSSDLRSGLEVYQQRVSERADWHRRARRFERRLEAIRTSRGVRAALKVRHSWPVRTALRPLRPIKRRIMRQPR
ncbi:MAG TPA: glycosyltransferase family 4 protein [Solirubrobacteraceae bacterium]|nr:glycosyltransferase family 4 protein [Solirubrobacteraceae bacterium]